MATSLGNDDAARGARRTLHHRRRDPHGGGSHSSTYRLNVSAFCGIGVHVGVA